MLELWLATRSDSFFTSLFFPLLPIWVFMVNKNVLLAFGFVFFIFFFVVVASKLAVTYLDGLILSAIVCLTINVVDSLMSITIIHSCNLNWKGKEKWMKKPFHALSRFMRHAASGICKDHKHKSESVSIIWRLISVHADILDMRKQETNKSHHLETTMSPIHNYRYKCL